MEVETNSAKAWMLAARPKTLAAAACPVIVGSALAWHYGNFKATAALICLFFALLMQIAANFINDLIDYEKGSDGTERLGPQRATAQGWITPKAMKAGIVIDITLACAIGLTILYFTSWEIIFVGLACVIFAYLYTSGPYPLSYHGLGDIAVVVFFGVVPVCFTCYVQTGIWTATGVALGIATGFVVNALLIVNNYRDRDSDKKSGKMTLIAIFGEKFGRYFYLTDGLLATLICVVIFVLERKYIGAALILIYGLRHVVVWKKLDKIREGSALNVLIGQTSANMILFGVLTTLGFCL